MCALNPWSVCNKADVINDFIIDQKLDLLALTETWLADTDSTTKSALLPEGYSLLLSPRGSRGGGAAVVYRDTLKVRQVNTTQSFESFEFIECTIESTVSVRLCVIYRPPVDTLCGKFCEEFADYMSQVMTSPGQPLIVGDFNYHVNKAGDTTNKYGRWAADFLSVCSSFSLTQHVTGPTQRYGNTLDLVLSREDDTLVTSATATDHGFPDHYPVFTHLSLRKPKLPTKEVSYRKLNTVGSQTLDEAISQSALLSASLEGTPLSELPVLYNTELRTILDDLAPQKTRTITIRPEAKWYSMEIRRAKQVRRQAERRWRNKHLEVHRQSFLKERERVNIMICTAKTQYYQGLISEHHDDTKQLFNITNKLLGKKNESPLPSGSDKDIATMFSDYFIEKIDKIRDSIPSDNIDLNIPPPTAVTSSLIEFQSVSEQEVTKIIMSSPSKSCDLDPLPTSLVKMALPQLIPVITSIINASLHSGTFPTSYKQALVAPLLKKPTLDQEVLKNFRPVSNLAFLSKVLEKAVASQLERHLMLNNLHEPYQSAYRKGHSTETALVRVQNDIIRAIGEQKVVLFVMLDLSAAFDTVNHQCLLSILRELGVDGQALEWFSSYLECRRQVILIHGTCSDSRDVSCGVPQGSVLGPILFTVYTSSLGRLLREQVPDYHFYADDSDLYLCARPSQLVTASHQLEDCIRLVQTWMCKHQLKMNDEKTEFLVISSKQMAPRFTPPTLTIGNSEITAATSARNLGVTQDQFASMELHISNICRGAYFQLKNISKLRRYFDRESLECLVHAFVTSRLDYCNSLFCGLPSTLLKRLQRIQNTAARILTKTPKHDHISPVLESLHWLPIEKRVDFKTLLLVFKAIHHLAPVYLQELIIPHTPSRTLRSADKHLLHVPFTSSTLVMDRAFSVAGPRLWNGLPHDLRTVQSLELFKSKLKTHLFRKAYN